MADLELANYNFIANLKIQPQVRYRLIYNANNEQNAIKDPQKYAVQVSNTTLLINAAA